MALRENAASPIEVVEQTSATTLGFWLYILSDVMIFGALFATFMVLRHNTAGGPSGAEIFEPQYVLIQTIALLASSYTAALALSAARHGLLRRMWQCFVMTGALGLVFLGLEVREFMLLVSDGDSWQVSGFLSSFFALVGTHGLHITIGLLWLTTLFVAIKRRGLTSSNSRKLGLFTIFWHFLDVVWIGIFAIVYMFGVGVG